MLIYITFNTRNNFKTIFEFNLNIFACNKRKFTRAELKYNKKKKMR